MNGVYAEEFHNKTSTIINLEAKNQALKRRCTDFETTYGKEQEYEKIKSELDKAVELLKSCKLDPQRDDSEELYQQIQDFLKDK